MDKIRNKLKNVNWSNILQVILTIILVTALIGFTATLFSGSSSGGGSSSGSGNNQPASPISYYTITFDANGGSGVMEKQTVPDIGNTTVYTHLKSNTFTHSTDGWYFKEWNTSADGSGTSYTGEQYIGVDSDITLYAQWTKDVTISYYKIYAAEWESVYPPAENSGPVKNDEGTDYLIATLDGVSLYGLGDYFTVNDETSPVRTANAYVGSELYIELNNKYDGELCAIYVNDVLKAGKSAHCDLPFIIPDCSNITVTFTWHTTGVVGVNPQSFWVCNIIYN